jgi:hypothetical protein
MIRNFAVVCGLFMALNSFAENTRPIGGEVPVPFSQMNQRVELADGETYYLEGRVVISDDQPYFEVDLVKQPWLANQKRKEHPYYPVEGGSNYWKRFENLRIQLTCQARSSILISVFPKTEEYVISLRPTAEPISVNATSGGSKR